MASNDEKVDPIGACVGQKGVRVQNIMEELNGERIDVIQWHEGPLDFIRASLSPARIVHIKIAENEKRAAVFVEPDQRPLAIGKQGQNVSLASILTGYELDIKDVGDLPSSELKEASSPDAAPKPVEKETVEKIENLDGMTPALVEALKNVNFTDVSQLKGLSAKDLSSIEGINEAAADMIVDAVRKVK